MNENLELLASLRRWWQSLSKTTTSRYRKLRKQPSWKRFLHLATRPVFGRGYLLGSLLVLAITTIIWSWLGADLQFNNADQLVSPLMFSDGPTFHGAVFPGAHTFLLKWPLFYIVKLFEFSQASYLIMTVLVVLATVGGLVLLLSRIERRPIALGTICLALAAVLLAIPTQPYPGALLPVSMAMLTTRNLEYVVYVLALALLVKAPRIRSRQFLWSLLLLGMLVASDNLFLTMSVAASLLALVLYALRQRTRLVSLSAHWLVLAVMALGIGIGSLLVLNQVHVTHIHILSVTGPYGADHESRALGLGVFYAVLGLLTNFGANPAYDAITIGQLPRQALHHLLSFGGPLFFINALIFLIVAVVAIRLFLKSLRSGSERRISSAEELFLLLFWATIAVCGLFAVSNHYYVVDARYLAISLFAGMVGLAVWVRSRSWFVEVLLAVGLLLTVACGFGVVNAFQTRTADTQALQSLTERNASIAQTLRHHRVKALVGDYWRVVPLKVQHKVRQTIVPLGSCGQPRMDLSSSQWQPDLYQTSFAYLLTLEGSLTDYPGCSLKQVVAAYGEPNSSVLVAGSLSHPQEYLLFYDNGIHPPSFQLSKIGSTAGTILPIQPEDLPNTVCHGPSVMNIVAHQDDDLLFLSPDLLHELHTGHCVRTIYLTAGDAGNTEPYWLSREQGSEAAYSQMLGSDQPWITRTVALAPGEFAAVANPHNNNRVSLIFLRLPDGNMHGEGFAASHFDSLAGLKDGRINSMTSVDGQSKYTAEQLTTALASLMRIYQPAQISTQSSYHSNEYPDHSDHVTTGMFAQDAHNLYQTDEFNNSVSIPLNFYRGYTIHESPANISDGDLADKAAAFLAYAHFDHAVCRSLESCLDTPTYGAYLSRQYQNGY